MNRFILSPEFQRNLWLQFSPLRLLVGPLLVAALSYMFVKSSGRHAIYDLTQWMFWIYWLVAVIWGAQAASGALSDEVRNNTWDFQRTSSISPVAFTFGKLFGVTSYIWYLSVLIWVVFSFSFLSAENSQTSVMMPDDIFKSYLYTSMTMFVAALFAQVLAMLLGGSAISSGKARKSRRIFNESFPGFLSGVIAGTYIYFAYAFSPLARSNGLRPHDLLTERATQWFDNGYDAATFAFASLAFFLAWAYVGLWRHVKSAFSFSLYPLVWPAFVAVFATYIVGFSPVGAFGRTAFWFLIALGMTYAMMIIDAHDMSVYRHLKMAFDRKDKEALLKNMPLWLVSLPLVLLSALYAATLSGPESKPMAVTAMAAALLFFARDALVLHVLALRKVGDRFMIIVYFLFAYLILPGIHVSAKLSKVISGIEGLFRRGKEFKASMDGVFAIYYPTGFEDWWMSIIPPLCQVLLVSLFFVWYWGQKKKA